MSEAPAEADERDLTVRAFGGDEEALGRLLALHQAWAYNLAYRVVGHEADARDAVQDAFLQTVRSVRGDGAAPHDADRFRPWLRRVVTNAAVTQVRRRGRPATSVDALADTLPAPASDEPGHAVDQVETRGRVLQVLLGLPESQRVALALREYLDASYDDIAEALDLPRTAIGTLLFRARAAFRSSYHRVEEASPATDCPDVVPLFASIVDGEPRPENWQALEEHLRTCEACGAELDSQRRARRLYGLLPLLILPAGWEPIKAALGGATASGASLGAATGQAAGGAAAADAPLAASTPVATPAVASAAGAPVASAAGVTSGGGVAGLLAGVSGAKLTLAALATAAVVGAGVVSAPFVGPADTPVASPPPLVGMSASPSPAPGGSPGVAASPVGSPSPTALGGPSAPPSPAPAVSPSPGPSDAVTPSTPTPTLTPSGTQPTGATAGPTSPPTAPPSSPVPLMRLPGSPAVP